MESANGAISLVGASLSTALLVVSVFAGVFSDCFSGYRAATASSVTVLFSLGSTSWPFCSSSLEFLRLRCPFERKCLGERLLRERSSALLPSEFLL